MKRISWLHICLCSVVGTMWCISPAWGQRVAPRDLPILDLKARNGAERAVQPSPGQMSAAAQMRRGRRPVEVTWNLLTGTPRSVVANEGLLSSKSPDPGSQIVLRYLNEHQSLFGLSPADISSLKVARESERSWKKAGDRGGGLPRIVVLDQVWDGRQVYSASYVAGLSGAGEIVSIRGEAIPGLAKGVSGSKPALSSTTALVRAAKDLGADLNPSTLSIQRDSSGFEDRQTISTTTANGPPLATARLVYYPIGQNDVRLSWEIATGKPGSQLRYQYMVDAITGDILLRAPLTSSDVPQWLVYFYKRGAKTAAPDQVVPLDSPSPRTPYTASTNAPVIDLPRNLIQTNGSPEASPQGWIPAGSSSSDGNNVVNQSGVAPSVTASLRDVNGLQTRTFDFTLDLSNPSSPDSRKASVVNAVFAANWYHDRFYLLGFDEAAGAFQMANFTISGGANDPLIVAVQAVGNNASFTSATADGMCCPIMAMGLFTGPDPDRDSAFEQLILLHELTHGLTDRLVGGPNNVGLNKSTQAHGLAEGYSDWFALTLTSAPSDTPEGLYGESGWSVEDNSFGQEFVDPALDPPAVTGTISFHFDQHYLYGLRRFPYTTNMDWNPLTLADTDPATFNIDGAPLSPWFVDYKAFLTSVGRPDLAPGPTEFHAVGEVWAVALWEVRAKLIERHGWKKGNDLALRIVTSSLAMLAETPTIIEARDAVVQADFAMTGGQNYCAVWRGFAKRGMGLGASTPVNGELSGVVERFTLPPRCTGKGR